MSMVVGFSWSVAFVGVGGLPVVCLRHGFSLTAQEKQWNKGSRKWKIWKGRSTSSRAPSEASDCSPRVAEDVYNVVIATIARAPAKDFRVVREEWAAIRVQTAFRGFLV